MKHIYKVKGTIVARDERIEVEEKLSALDTDKFDLFPDAIVLSDYGRRLNCSVYWLEEPEVTEEEE